MATLNIGSGRRKAMGEKRLPPKFIAPRNLASRPETPVLLGTQRNPIPNCLFLSFLGHGESKSTFQGQ